MRGKAIVVGGTRRVGRWVTETLLEEGWRVGAVYHSREAEALALAKESQANSAGTLRLAKADITDENRARLVLGLGIEKELDMLVYCAGMSMEKRLSLTTPGQLEALWRSNVLAVHNAVVATLPMLEKAPTGQGRIILFSMVGAGQKAFRDVPAYGACKAMLESYTRSLAKELVGERITVNCIALGMTELLPDGAPDYEHTEQSTWKRIGQADVAGLIRYLASAESEKLTGAVIPLGGGFGL